MSENATEIPDVTGLPGGARAALEAILMVTDQPVTTIQLAAAVGLPTATVADLLEDLAREYRGEGGPIRGFELRQVDDGWRIFSAPAYAGVVGRFILDGATSRLTQAALETLAIVAYRQPVTRAQISSVRGVNVESVLRTLTSRGLVVETGTDPITGAISYGTTTYFLERMGIASLDELPPIAEHLPDLTELEGL